MHYDRQLKNYNGSQIIKFSLNNRQGEYYYHKVANYTIQGRKSVASPVDEALCTGLEEYYAPSSPVETVKSYPWVRWSGPQSGGRTRLHEGQRGEKHLQVGRSPREIGRQEFPGQWLGRASACPPVALYAEGWGGGGRR